MPDLGDEINPYQAPNAPIDEGPGAKPASGWPSIKPLIFVAFIVMMNVLLLPALHWRNGYPTGRNTDLLLSFALGFDVPLGTIAACWFIRTTKY